MWQELWWAMGSGVMSEYDRIKKIDVVEFWALFDLWKQKNEREREAIRSRNKK